MDTVYMEDYLPYDQPPISTSNTHSLIEQVNRWWNCVEQFSAPIGFIVGAPETGKTMAVHSYLLRREPEQRAKCAIVEITPRATRRSILDAIFCQLGISSQGRLSYYQKISQLQDISQRGQAPLLVLDGADYFLDDTGHLEPTYLEILSALVRYTSCFVLLVCTQKLLTGVELVPRLSSRIGLTHQFGVLSDAEVYELFLPQLVLPRWKFRPLNEEDIFLGRYLFRKISF
jgi:Cdc6-like AAA superfamily ATPase